MDLAAEGDNSLEGIICWEAGINLIVDVGTQEGGDVVDEAEIGIGHTYRSEAKILKSSEVDASGYIEIKVIN